MDQILLNYIHILSNVADCRDPGARNYLSLVLFYMDYPASTPAGLPRRWPSIETTPGERIMFAGNVVVHGLGDTPQATLDHNLISPDFSGLSSETISASQAPSQCTHLYSMCTMLDQRRRRWSSIVQMLYTCFVFAELRALHYFYWIIV